MAPPVPTPVQACCLIKTYYGEDVPVLVVTPKSLREAWADALYLVGRFAFAGSVAP